MREIRGGKMPKIVLEELPMELSFWANDGQVIRSYEQLPAALKRMRATAFRHHVNNEKNDFANWVRDVIHDDALAKELEKEKRKSQTLDMARSRIRELKK